MCAAVFVWLLVGGISLLAAGAYVFFQISASRFDCDATRQRMCSDATLKNALLPDAYLYCLHQLITKAHQAFTESEMPYVAIGGTLLSAIRHGSLIPWDDDADVAVFASHWDDISRKTRFKEALRRHGLKLTAPSVAGFITERVVFLQDDPSLDAQPFIDVFIYAAMNTVDDLHFQDLLSRLKFPQEATTRDEIFPIAKTVLKYKKQECEVNIPAKAEQKLTKSYGAGWRKQFIVATHRDTTMVAPCMLSDEQAASLGLMQCKKVVY